MTEMVIKSDFLPFGEIFVQQAEMTHPNRDEKAVFALLRGENRVFLRF